MEIMRKYLIQEIMIKRQILMKVLDVIELEYEDKRKAGMLDNDLNVRKSEGTDKIWLCTNHIMEYYIYACCS